MQKSQIRLLFPDERSLSKFESAEGPRRRADLAARVARLREDEDDVCLPACLIFLSTFVFLLQRRRVPPSSSSSSCSWRRLGRRCTFFRPQCTHCTRRKLFRRPSKSSLSQQTANLRKSQGRPADRPGVQGAFLTMWSLVVELVKG